MVVGAVLMFAGTAFCVFATTRPGEAAVSGTVLWLVVAAIFAFMGIALLKQRR